MTPEERSAGVAAEFRQRFGRNPDVICAAPGRINLIGEHTDYNDGLVLPCAIDRWTVVAVGRRDDDVVTGWSAQRGVASPVRVPPGPAPRVPGWLGYVAGVVWALGADTGRGTGIEVVVDSDVPPGAGLSSSAALECAVALSLAEMAPERAWTRLDLAQASQRAEHEVVGAPVGLMDQAVSMLAEVDTALFLDCRSLETALVPLVMSAADLALVVVDTRVTHSHATGGYATRREECAQAAVLLGLPSLREADLDEVTTLPEPLLRRARHVVTENGRVEAAVQRLRDGDVADLASLLEASHASLRDDFEVSAPELDLAVDASRAAGAVGARMTGGGFGGSAIALVPRDAVGEVARAVEAAFDAHGFRPPAVFPVQVSGGARRLEVV